MSILEWSDSCEESSLSEVTATRGWGETRGSFTEKLPGELHEMLCMLELHWYAPDHHESLHMQYQHYCWCMCKVSWFHGYYLWSHRWNLIGGICDETGCVFPHKLGSAEPRDHFTNLWAPNWYLAHIVFDLVVVLMTKSGHNFAHVTTAQLSWHVQNCDLIWSLFAK